MAAQNKSKVGLWMIGACGGVGSTVTLGVSALRRRLIPRTGMVTDLPPFRDIGLCDPGSIVIGGHEIRREGFLDSVQSLRERSGVFSDDIIRKCGADLRAMQRNVRPGTLMGAGRVVRELADRKDIPRDRSALAAMERIAEDIRNFQERHRLSHVVVMHVASSEPPLRSRAKFESYTALRKKLASRGGAEIPTSCIYALAAIEARCAYVNFTPSTGIRLPAIRERADELDLPYMGNDGKTGETLIKSALAPMFAMRNLEVLSWSGQNILGNRDGQVLRDPTTRKSKIASKDGLISRIVGGKPETLVSIDYVSSLDDWKVAWDFIHFAGFFNTKMSMQFTWQGCDSLLAAPLVIDLTRLAAREMERGGGGPMRHLGFFFKDPLDVKEQNLFRQWQGLLESIRPRI
ncbi:MAG: inositol-3-phosphate synthase [Planctomycetes bacterium]|nr:inositol-3-phosphate synthase [Planctomycetota bacterium]MBI3834211.1 inositol-3-phosphate synthase [Planctomycetota bacterium]